MKKGDILYYAKCIPNIGIYDIITIKVRGVYDNYFVTLDRSGSKQARLFNYDEIGKTIFEERKDAVIYSEEQEKLHKNEKTFSSEVFYEEY